MSHYIYYVYLGNHLRFLTIMFLLSMVIGEMLIYAKLYYILWNNDERMKKYISSGDLCQRKRKNIISLSGQVISFFVEFFFSLFIIANVMNQNLVDSSLFPIFNIAISTIISICQLSTSHELKRYIRSLFDI